MDDKILSDTIGRMHYPLNDIAQATLFGHILGALISVQDKNDPRGDNEIKKTVEVALKYFEHSWFPLKRSAEMSAMRKVQEEIRIRTNAEIEAEKIKRS